MSVRICIVTDASPARRGATIGAAALVAMGLFAVAGARAQVVVNPDNMGNWSFSNSDVNGTVGANPTGSGGMVVGPATPPLGVGSANLSTGDGTAGGDGAEILSNTGYSGVPLNALTTLSYSTYVTQNNGQQFPYLQIETATGLSGSDAFDQLFFEPPYQTSSTGTGTVPDQASPILGAWQTWDALNGAWWDNDGFCGAPGGGFGNVASLNACTSTFIDPTIVNTTGDPTVLNGVGGVQFDVGFASATDKFNGNVDAFSIGINGATTTYDFEPVPEPASIAIFGAALAGLAGMRRRFQRR